MGEKVLPGEIKTSRHVFLLVYVLCQNGHEENYLGWACCGYHIASPLTKHFKSTTG